MGAGIIGTTTLSQSSDGADFILIFMISLALMVITSAFLSRLIRFIYS